MNFIKKQRKFIQFYNFVEKESYKKIHKHYGNFIVDDKLVIVTPKKLFMLPAICKTDFIVNDISSKALPVYKSWFDFEKNNIKEINTGYIDNQLFNQLVCDKSSDTFIDIKIRNFLLSIFGTMESIKKNVSIIFVYDKPLLYFEQGYIKCLYVPFIYESECFNNDTLLKILAKKDYNDNFYIISNSEKSRIVTKENKNHHYYNEEVVKFNNVINHLRRFLAGKQCKDYHIYYKYIEDYTKN